MHNYKQKSITWSQTVSIVLIRGYQTLRPLLDGVVLSTFGIVSKCKHQPSCSEYTIQAIRRHGTIAGIRLGVTRVLKCR